MKKFKTRGKLQIAFAIIMLAIIVTLTISLKNIIELKQIHAEVDKLNEIVYNIAQLRSNENRTRVLTYDILTTKDDTHKKAVLDELISKDDSLKEKFKSIMYMLKDYPQFTVFIDTINADSDLYFRNSRILIDYINSGKMQEAYSYIDTITPFYSKIRAESIALENAVIQIRDKMSGESVRTTKHVTIELISLGLILIILTLVLAVLVLRMIRRITVELVYGVNILSKSATGILDTVNDISTGASETATAVSETTTTIEEVRQTATVANEKAQALIESSQKAADSAEKGKTSVVNVADAIKKIDNQMKMITETVLKLAEQNRTIGEITSTVSDIADQSNLLAVNAAIEAAKAGEHGRGFTIVAQEIRSLADQSKKATKQVKEILNEINKSVIQAVGVTEQGSRTVENGLQLVRQNGEIIDLLAENVDETAQASMQISSSNYQQMAGMDQIVPAMENIKMASEQNIKGIQQAQTASKDINDLSKTLRNVIEKYDL